jgi:uncharacterized protein YndB with AHSA1/START domain
LASPIDPKTSAIYALNDIDVNAPPEVVWKLLVDAENWSSYFPAEDQVKILTGEPELALGTKYSRVTVGFPMHLIVTECVPGRRLAWSTLVDGDETGSSAYHGWVITPTDTAVMCYPRRRSKAPSSSRNSGARIPVRSTAITRNGSKALRARQRLEAAKRLSFHAVNIGESHHRRGHRRKLTSRKF